MPFQKPWCYAPTMAAPVRPSDYQKLIVTPDDNLASAIVKLIKCVILTYKLLRYFHDPETATGISQAFQADICKIQCPGADTNTTRLPT